MSVSELTFIICLFSIQIFFVPVWLFLLSSKSSNIMERISSCLESLFVRRTTILCLIFYTNTLDNILLTSVGKSSAIISFLNIYNLPYVFLVVVFFLLFNCDEVNYCIQGYFRLCYFRPPWLADGFAPSWTRLDIVVSKERYVKTLEYAQFKIRLFTTRAKGAKVKRGRIFHVICHFIIILIC